MGAPGYGVGVERPRRFSETPGSIPTYDVFIDFSLNEGRSIVMPDLLRPSMLIPPDLPPSSVGATEEGR